MSTKTITMSYDEYQEDLSKEYTQGFKVGAQEFYKKLLEKGLISKHLVDEIYEELMGE